MTVENHNPATAEADADAAAYLKGSMEINEQASTYDLFMGMTKWGSLITAVTLVFITVWFAVGAGFMAAAITAIVMSVIGWFALKSKPAAH